MKSYLFAGQGSQHAGMGQALLERYPREVAAADEVMGYSMAALCLRDEGRRLSDTLYAQPAIHIVNCLSYLQRVDDGVPAPDWLAGHSLGELAALFAAGAFTFEDGMCLVKKRAELMAQANGGGMVAVLGMTQEEVRDVLGRHGLDSLDIANLNAPAQVVIAGPKNDVLRAAPLLVQGGAADAIPLRVSAAFHSRYMVGASREFGDFLARMRLRDPEIPVISNVTAQPHGPGESAELLVRQIVSPVRWSESIQRLMGVPGMQFEPLGPGNVIASMLKTIQREATPLGPPVARRAAPAPVPAVVTDVASLPNPGPVAARAWEAVPGGPSSAAPAQAAAPAAARTAAQALGDPAFLADHGVRLAYVAGAMYKGIASVPLVARMANAGLLAFYGAGGQPLEVVEQAIADIRRQSRDGARFGMNLLASPTNPALEKATVELYLRHRVESVEAAAYTQVTPGLVKYRLAGLRLRDGRVACTHRVLAKVSHPAVAEAFLRPAPQSLVQQLLEAGEIDSQQADWSRRVPMTDDLCAEADSGGHTDGMTPFALLPSMLALRDRLGRELGLPQRVRVGAAGGLGTPHAVAAAFLMGADFVLTGSVNQCTPEAGTSDLVKDMLAGIDVHDTAMCPSGDWFETGARIQVLRKGLFFPARAQRLYELWQRHASLDEIDAASRSQIEEKYFGRTIDEVWDETRRHWLRADPEQVAHAERNPRHKMALVFRWYFVRTSRLAREGDRAHKVNFQVHCGPALGAFNQWARGGPLEDWRRRHVDEVGQALMTGAAAILARGARREAAR